MWYLDTEHPVAVNSIDHIYPIGTKDDNYSSGNFNTKFRRLLGRNVTVLDLGCAGGGFVKSLLDEGWKDAVGLEGSDYSLVRKRAEWATIPDHLFTCDITCPFILHHGDHLPHQFDVVTMWEVIEHIETGDLPNLFANINNHLRRGGLFILTTPYYSRNGERSNGPTDHHRTRCTPEWWDGTITGFGFTRQPDAENHFGRFWLRDGKVRRVFSRD